MTAPDDALAAIEARGVQSPDDALAMADAIIADEDCDRLVEYGCDTLLVLTREVQPPRPRRQRAPAARRLRWTRPRGRRGRVRAPLSHGCGPRVCAATPPPPCGRPTPRSTARRQRVDACAAIVASVALAAPTGGGGDSPRPRRDGGCGASAATCYGLTADGAGDTTASSRPSRSPAPGGRARRPRPRRRPPHGAAAREAAEAQHAALAGAVTARTLAAVDAHRAEIARASGISSTSSFAEGVQRARIAEALAVVVTKRAALDVALAGCP